MIILVEIIKHYLLISYVINRICNFIFLAAGFEISVSLNAVSFSNGLKKYCYVTVSGVIQFLTNNFRRFLICRDLLMHRLIVR